MRDIEEARGTRDSGRDVSTSNGNSNGNSSGRGTSAGSGSSAGNGITISSHVDGVVRQEMMGVSWPHAAVATREPTGGATMTMTGGGSGGGGSGGGGGGGGRSLGGMNEYEYVDDEGTMIQPHALIIIVLWKSTH